MSSFLHSLPASELDDLMRLVKQTHAHAEQQPQRAQQQRRWADQRAIAPESALAFVPPPDCVAAGSWSPTRDSPDTVQPQQLDYLSGLAQQRDHQRAVERPQTELSSASIASSAAAPSQPHHSRGSKHQRRVPPAETEKAGSVAAVAASSSVAAAAVSSNHVVHPYCTIPAHLESAGLDAVSSLNPDAEDARGLRALDSAWQQVCTNTANIAESRKDLDTLKSSVVQTKIDEVRAKVAEEKDNEHDRAMAKRRITLAASQLSPKAFASAKNRREQVISPHLLRMQRVQQQQQQQATRAPSSSPARDCCSSLAVDPLAPDVLHELTSELVQLQHKYASLSEQHAFTLERYESELASTREAAKREGAKLRAHFNARIKSQEQHHAQKLEAAAKSSAHEVDFLRAQVAQLQRGQTQARDLVQSWMSERQSKDRRTRTEQALLDLLCQPALVLDPTQPPPAFPLALQNLPPAACVEPSGPGASTAPAAQQPPIPAFASTLLKELPSSVLPYSVTNDELSKLRVSLHKAREDLRLSRAHEETAKAAFQELVITHKNFKSESNKTRLRMQAQLLGCVRRLKWSADEKSRLDGALKEQSTYTAAVEKKLITATKRILHFQECASRARSRREDNMAQQARAQVQRREAKSLVLDAELEGRVWAGAIGRVTSPHLANRLSERADSRPHEHDAMPAAAAGSTFVFGQPLQPPHPRSDTQHSHHSLPSSPAASPTSAQSRPLPSAKPATAAATSASLLSFPASRETDRWIHELESEVEAMAVHLESNHAIRRSPSPSPSRAPVAVAQAGSAPTTAANRPAESLAMPLSSCAAGAPAPAPVPPPARPPPLAVSAAAPSVHAPVSVSVFSPEASDSSVSSEVLSCDSDGESDFDFEFEDEQFGRHSTAEQDAQAAGHGEQDAAEADVSSASHASLKEQLAELSVRMRLADQQVAEAKARRAAAAAASKAHSGSGR